MKVARKHIIAAIENPRRLMFYPKYVIKAIPYTGEDTRIGEFGWTIAVVPAKHKPKRAVRTA